VEGKEGSEEHAIVKTPSSFSPIEAVFHKHMKKTLMAYEQYYQELVKKHAENEGRLQKEFAAKMAQIDSLKAQNKDRAQFYQQQLNDMSNDAKQPLAQLQTTFQNSVSLLLGAYDKYLEEHLIVPSMLPVNVTVSLGKHNIQFQKVQLKPITTIEDVKQIIVKKLQDIGNPLVAFTPDCSFILRESMSNKERPLSDHNIPIMNLGICQGDTIILVSGYQLKNDLPKECFSASFDKSKENVMDYYTCKDCKFNWICGPCAEQCHKGHVITEYITNHHPTWACCYCMKNKKCKIVNLKTKGGQ